MINASGEQAFRQKKETDSRLYKMVQIEHKDGHERTCQTIARAAKSSGLTITKAPIITLIYKALA